MTAKKSTTQTTAGPSTTGTTAAPKTAKPKTLPRELDGLITEEIGDALQDLAANVTGGVIVEIGSYRGQSTAYLAAGAKISNTKVHAIDPWDLQGHPGKHGFNHPDVRADFEKQLKKCGLWTTVTPHRAYSTQVAKGWTEPVGLLYIDGDHTKVADDLNAWAPHLTDDAVICCDDYGTRRNPKVKIHVDQWARENGRTVTIVAERLAVL